MGEHGRDVSAGVSSRRRGVRRALLAVAAVGLLAALYGGLGPERNALRGPAGEPPAIPDLQVRPVPKIDRAEPGWRMPEEETLPRRLREREPLDPSALAAAPSTPEGGLPPALVPPQTLAPAPAPARVEPSGEPLQLARLETRPEAWDVLAGAPLRGAAPTSAARRLAAGPAASPAPAPRSDAVPSATSVPHDSSTPSVPHDPSTPSVPHTPAPPQRPPAEWLAPEGSVPSGVASDLGRGAPPATGAGGVPVPLPQPQPTQQGPSIVIDRDPAPIGPPAILRVPVSEGPPSLAPDPPAAPGASPDPPAAPGLLSGKSKPFDVARVPPGRPLPPGLVQRGVVVPEPGTLLLVAGGLLLLAGRRRYR